MVQSSLAVSSERAYFRKVVEVRAILSLLFKELVFYLSTLSTNCNISPSRCLATFYPDPSPPPPVSLSLPSPLPLSPSPPPACSPHYIDIPDNYGSSPLMSACRMSQKR